MRAAHDSDTLCDTHTHTNTQVACPQELQQSEKELGELNQLCRQKPSEANQILSWDTAGRGRDIAFGLIRPGSPHFLSWWILNFLERPF